MLCGLVTWGWGLTWMKTHKPKNRAVLTGRGFREV